MEKIKEMQAGCLYIFEGQASSSSCFIQSEKDAESFIRLASTLLKDYLKIHEYKLDKNGWLMIVSLRSREKIVKSYKISRERSRTCERKNDHTKIWKIISEQIRKFLKRYVKGANKRSGREGSLVKGPYKRSYFSSLEEAQSHVTSIRKQIIRREQKLKKYRGRKRFYRIAKKKIKGHILLCTKWKNSAKSIDKYFRKMGSELQAIIAFEDLMASKLIIHTINIHAKPT